MDPKKRERLLLFAVVICIGAWAGDRLLMSPMVRLWKQRSQKIAEIERSLTKGRALVEREDGLREQWQEMKQRSLPQEVSVAEDQVLQSLSQWSQVSRLGVTSFKPRWIQGEEDNMKIECRAATQGSIGSVARFLYELERGSLALRVENMEIASRDDTGRDLTLDVRFTGLSLTGKKQ